MSQISTIEWTDATWNPVRGCTRISPGCGGPDGGGCYAERMAARLSGAGRPYEGFAKRTPAGARWTGEVRLIHERLGGPLHWRKPRRIFINSMSDLFHEALPLADIRRVFDVICRAPRHTYQLLTKRSARLRELAPLLPWAPQIWAGVSVEHRDYRGRIDDLRATPARVRFLSLEPLLGPLAALNLEGIHWVIVGAESGPRARLMDLDWVRGIRDQCLAAGVAFFFKQAATPGGRKIRLPALDGRQWAEFPDGTPQC
jgi:protein gp37